MNNIRKIITERLENARKERDKCEKNRDLFASIRVTGNIQICQELLNLIPAPRTEDELIKEFEKLGWYVADGYVNFTLKKTITKNSTFGEYICYCYISIDKEIKTYSAEERCNWNTKGYNLSMQEHKLLNELFEVVVDDK